MNIFCKLYSILEVIYHDEISSLIQFVLWWSKTTTNHS